MLSGELGGGGRSVDRYGLIDGFATSIEAAPRTLDGRTEGPWDGGTDTDFGGRGTGRVARQQRKEREEEGGRDMYRKERKEGCRIDRGVRARRHQRISRDRCINAAVFNFRNVPPKVVPYTHTYIYI